MNALRDHIAAVIAADGPLTIGGYMSLALGHPEFGYYMRRDPFGVSGDFITAPEISQIFGELIGLWCVQSWLDMGAPDSFALVELGPGRGTLMADILRAAALRPAFCAAAQIHLVETSPALRAVQQQALSGHPVQWHAGVDALPALPCLIVANEFFDALPIRQFEYRDGKWHERMVVHCEDRGFTVELAPQPVADTALLRLDQRCGAIEQGAVAEVSLAAQTVCEMLATHISHYGGAALLIDYGPARSAFGDSFQAMQAHQFVSPFVTPGDADLTAHVDFAALALAATTAGALVDGPVTQADFLKELGIEYRAAALSQKLDPEARAAMAETVKRLIGPEQMGQLFKVLAMRAPALSERPGFSMAQR